MNFYNEKGELIARVCQEREPAPEIAEINSELRLIASTRRLPERKEP